MPRLAPSVVEIATMSLQPGTFPGPFCRGRNVACMNPRLAARGPFLLSASTVRPTVPCSVRWSFCATLRLGDQDRSGEGNAAVFQATSSCSDVAHDAECVELSAYLVVDLAESEDDVALVELVGEFPECRAAGVVDVVGSSRVEDEPAGGSSISTSPSTSSESRDALA